MEKESKLRYSLAVALSLVLIFDTALTWFAAKGAPFISAQEAIPIGIKWMLLAGGAVAAFATAFWIHRVFLDAGISPVDTTWADFMVIAYVLMTLIALLFIGETVWFLFAVFLFLLFVFSAFALRKLLDSTKGWASWLVGTVLLSGLAIVFISTILPTS
jgi:hypothetical protein